MHVEAVAYELLRESGLGLAPPAEPRVRPRRNPAVEDQRFRRLLRDDEWMELPAAVRRRFSTRLPDGGAIVYAGEVLETRMSRAGWWLSQALRLIGGPLPTSCGAHLPSVVTVTGDRSGGGQNWTRMYARRKGFPQVVHSAKRFAGPSGLEEYVGYGVGMTLSLHVRDGALVFSSKDYFLQVFGRRVFLPKWLCPGALTVTHAEVPDGRFAFTLEIVHPRLGLLLRQMALYRELVP